MALTSANVRVGVSGVISVAPTATTAPTDASTALAVGFLAMGYVSDNGVTETIDRSTNDIHGWQNGDTVRTVLTDSKVTYKFSLIETSKATIEFAYGTTVTQSAPMGTYTINAGTTGGRKSFVLDVIDGANLKRIYVAEAEVTELGDTTYASGEAVGYDVTLTCYTAPVVFDTALKTP